MKMVLRLLLTGVGLAAGALLLPRLYTALRYQPLIRTFETAPAERVAIVFGAGLTRSGLPTTVLRDRVAVAVELYRLGKVQKLLLSGDNRFENYNEPGAMREAALALGVPESDLVLDYAGRSTYDTCYRAKAIFGVERAVLVTQNFHLPRALFICDALGLPATGVSADLHTYRRFAQAWWQFREIFATANAWWDVTVAHPVPVLGEEIPIP